MLFVLKARKELSLALAKLKESLIKSHKIMQVSRTSYTRRAFLLPSPEVQQRMILELGNLALPEFM